MIQKVYCNIVFGRKLSNSAIVEWVSHLHLQKIYILAAFYLCKIKHKHSFQKVFTLGTALFLIWLFNFLGISFETLKAFCYLPNIGNQRITRNLSSGGSYIHCADISRMQCIFSIFWAPAIRFTQGIQKQYKVCYPS